MGCSAVSTSFRSNGMTNAFVAAPTVQAVAKATVNINTRGIMQSETGDSSRLTSTQSTPPDGVGLGIVTTGFAWHLSPVRISRELDRDFRINCYLDRCCWPQVVIVVRYRSLLDQSASK